MTKTTAIRKTKRRTGAKQSRASVQPFPRRGHDHDACVERAVAHAVALCARRGLDLTSLRRRVLALVWRSHEPIGAYAILRALRRRGRVDAPPIVYRALEFLLNHGLIHRIESRSAYVGCAKPGSAHAGQFMICSKCGATAELNDKRIGLAVARGAKRLGFSIERQTIEITGLCPRCTKPFKRRKKAPRSKR